MPATFGAVGAFYDSGSDQTSHEIPVPSGVSSTSFIVIVTYVNDNIAISAMPPSFAEAPDSPQFTTAGVHGLHAMWKRAAGNDTGTYDFTTTTACYVNGVAIRYEGVLASGSPWDDTAGANDDTDGTASPAVSLTTTGVNRMLVWAASNWTGGSWTPPSVGGTWSERSDSAPGIMTAADFLLASAGSSGSITGTCTGSDKRCAWAGALISADAGGATPVPAEPIVVPSRAALHAGSW